MNIREAVANARKNRTAGGPGQNTTFVSGDTAGGDVKTQEPQPQPQEEQPADEND